MSHFIFNILIKYILIKRKACINLDQTPPKIVSARKVAMAGEGEKSIPIVGGSDKRAIRLRLIETLSGKLLN